MKINQNPYNSYYILNKKSYPFKVTIYPEKFIHEIHYQTLNNEITNINIFLKQNVEEIAKQHFFSIDNKTHKKQDPNNLTLSEIGISNSIAISKNYENLELNNILDNHTQGLIFNLLYKQYQLQEDIKQSLKDNNVNKTFNLYTQLQNLDIPDINSRDCMYGIKDNIPYQTL